MSQTDVFDRATLGAGRLQSLSSTLRACELRLHPHLPRHSTSWRPCLLPSALSHCFSLCWRLGEGRNLHIHGLYLLKNKQTDSEHFGHEKQQPSVFQSSMREGKNNPGAHSQNLSLPKILAQGLRFVAGLSRHAQNFGTFSQ